MKKNVNVIITIALILTLVAFFVSYMISDTPDYKEPIKNAYPLAENLDFTNDDEKLFAIIYLGDSKDSYNEKYYINKYFKDVDKEIIDNISTIQIGGSDKYLIIPKYEDIVFNLYNVKKSNDGELIESYIGHVENAFYLYCNDDPTYSNINIKIAYDGKNYSYSPGINKDTNKIVIDDYILEVS